MSQQARKLKKVQAKKLVKSNIYYNNFFREIAFLAVLKIFPVQKLIFEIAKNGFWSKNFFVKLIYLISPVFLAWNFLNFLAHSAVCVPTAIHSEFQFTFKINIFFQAKFNAWSNSKIFESKAIHT